MKTLREKIKFIQTSGKIESLSGPIPEEILDQEIAHIYLDWSNKSNDYCPTWMCKRIYGTKDEESYHIYGRSYYYERFICGNYFVEISKKELHQDINTYFIVFSKRKSEDIYWMDEEACRDNVVGWANLLFTELIDNNLGRDSDYYGFDQSEHWMEAKRRYGLKDNSTYRLALLTGIDPEGRFRCLGESIPLHIEYYLSLADLICGIFSGAVKSEIEEEDLWSSEMKSDCKTRFEWAMKMLSGLNLLQCEK
jgi:hypothetical protein